jgi:hypothetical protein
VKKYAIHTNGGPQTRVTEKTVLIRMLICFCKGQIYKRSEENTNDLTFTFMWPCIVTNFFVLKPTRWTNFTNLFCHETLHVSDSCSVHHQEFIHCTLSNGKQVCHTAFEQDQDGTAVPSWSYSKAVFKPVWHTPLLRLQRINPWWRADELPETCTVSW